MLNALGNYVNSMVIMSIIASLLMTLAPKGATRAIIGLISGLAVVLILLKPLANLQNVNLDSFILELTGKVSVSQNDIKVETDNLLKELIADKTSAYILTKAQALGIDCEVKVYVENGESLAPKAVEVTGKTVPDSKIQDKLSAFILADCGIPKERQVFIWQ